MMNKKVQLKLRLNNCTKRENKLIERGLKLYGTPNVLEICKPKLRPLIRKYLNIQ